MEERTSENGEKIEEIMLPGFRFHPTDEELVGFYLKRKIQQRPLSIELIKQLDIYKHDPWDLPKLAMTGEKEWYFYCPRDRKYRNSARPNRVTGAGFWKATGTDRPIYASEGSKCIGLKKSLVFYKGRAAKGVKTDWMMHEFRLPSLTDHTAPTKRFLEKTIPANDSWAICRIFKKASSTVQRTLSHSWVSPILQETTTLSSSDPNILSSQHGISSNNLQHSSLTSFSANIMDHTASNNSMSLYKPFNIIDQISPTLTTINNKLPQNSISSSEDVNYSTSYPYLFQELPNYGASKSSTVDVSSLLVNMPANSIFGDIDKSEGLDYITNGLHHHDHHQQYLNGCCFSITNLPVEIQENYANIHGGVEDHQEPAGHVTIAKGGQNEGCVNTHFEDQCGYPFMSLPLGLQDAWKSSYLCDSSSEISTGFSTTNKCYI